MSRKLADKMSEEDYQNLRDRISIGLSLMDLLWKIENRIENIMDSYEIADKNIDQILATACGDWSSDKEGQEGAIQQVVDEILAEVEH